MEKINFKGLVKNVLSKLPVFLFCVLFISGYNSIFGSENSIVGVVLLVGLLMFIKGDMGFNERDAALSIIAMFIILAFAPKASLINPFAGIFINFISIFIIMVISSYNISGGNHLTFMLGYIFCQGYDLSGELYNKRVLSLLVGSLVIASMYYIINKKKQYSKSIIDVIKETAITSQSTQWSLKLAVTLTLVMFAGDLYNYPRTMWISLAVLSVITPLSKEHVTRIKYRIPATILGTALFFVLFEKIIPVEYQSAFVLILGFLSMFITSYFAKTIYNSFSSLTTVVLFMPATEGIALRIISNIIGVIIGIIFYGIFTKIFRKLEFNRYKTNKAAF